MDTLQRSRIMHLSWEIQRSKKRSRSRSLMAAWAIFLTADITVQYLVKKHSHRSQTPKVSPAQITLFPAQFGNPNHF